MSQPAGTFNDGNLVFGAQQVTLTNPGGSPITYIADNVDFEEATRVYTRNNEFGVPQAEVLVNEVGTGSMTLQVPSILSVPVSASFPKRFAVGTIKDVDALVTINIKITKVGRKQVAEGETKVHVEFRVLLNP
jgi:hypothetical protein